MSMQVSYKKQFVLGIFLIIIFLGFIEISIRIIELNNYSNNNEYHEIFREFNKETTDRILSNGNFGYHYDKILLNEPNQKLNTININDFGFRGKEISLEKNSDSVRIFVIGGSTILSVLTSSDNTTIPGFLQQRFDEFDNTNKVEVINAGISNADSRSEIYLIKNYLLKFNPDLIIVYDGWNDAQHDWGWDDEVEDQNTLANLKNSFEIGFRSIYQTKIMPYYHTISFIEQIKRNSFSENSDNKDTENTGLDDTIIPIKTQKWIERWSSICEIGNERGFKTIISVQPVLGTGEKILTPEELNRLNENIKNQEIVIELLEEYSKALKILEKECYMTIDLRNSFDGISEPIYYDLGHMSDFGNKIIAEKIFEKIKTLPNQ